MNLIFKHILTYHHRQDSNQVLYSNVTLHRVPERIQLGIQRKVHFNGTITPKKIKFHFIIKIFTN